MPASVAAKVSVGEFIALAPAAGSGARASPKSSTFASPAAVEHDVARLEVAVHDALLMRGVERLGDLPGNLERLARAASGRRRAARQRLPVDVFEDQEPRALILFESVDAGDVRMVQRCQELRLAGEAGDVLGIAGQRFGQRLDGDRAAKLGVAGAIHHSHAARAQGRRHFIRTDPGAGGQRHLT